MSAAVVHLALADEVGGALAGSREALLPRASRPRPAGRRGRPRRRPRRRRACPSRTCPSSDVRVDRRADLERAVAVAPARRRRSCGGAPPSSARPRSRPASKLRVELLVVVAERRVGDLDARLRVRWSWRVGPRGRGASAVGMVAVSLARRRPRPAMAAMASGGRPPRSRPPSATSAAPCLPVRTKTPRRPTRWAAADVGLGVVADHRDVARAGGARRRDGLATQSPRSACAKTTGDGLPQMTAPDARSRTRGPRRTRRRRASGPRGVSHHGFRCIADELGAAAEQAERAVRGCRYVRSSPRVADRRPPRPAPSRRRLVAA